MMTSSQWRSPNYRPGLPRLEHEPNHYDLRLVDQFYAYCQAIATTDRHCEAAGRSRYTPTRTLCATMIACAAFGYYLFERLSAFTSLY